MESRTTLMNTIKRLLLSTLLLAIFVTTQSVYAKSNHSSPSIRLAVLLVFDQFRADYLTRFNPDFLPSTLPHGKVGGFRYLIEHGANFADCRYDHYPLYTSPGHAVIATGGEPYKTGIVSNSWYDLIQKKEIYAVSDSEFGKSPRFLNSPTIGDELKLATHGKSKVFALSLKDRAAILLGGFMSDGTFWFDSKTGTWTTSPFYKHPVPAWGEKTVLATIPSQLATHEDILTSPVGNELTFNLAKACVKEERLGRHDVPDFLAINFASNDYVGHKYGPWSQAVETISLESDRQLSNFLNFLNKTVPGGLDSVLIVVTADHGVSDRPDRLQSLQLPVTRIDPQETRNAVEQALLLRFGPGPWVANFTPPFLYFDPDTLQRTRKAESAVEYEAMLALLKLPGIQAAFGRTQILLGRLPDNEISQAIQRSFVPGRSGDVLVIPKINAAWYANTTTEETVHLTPYTYDTKVPLILEGPGIKSGSYLKRVGGKDIAPTLAYLLRITPPAASEGRILSEAIRVKP